MSKPAYWIVFISGREPEKFTQRASMRVFVAAQKLLGHLPIVKAIGGQS
ncbi:MAG: hypothetical protein YHS30scaffold667_40 [Phage 65_10]|nr:MAG: hypothetical protein YHS30scaffold667_40 [Phage 65_10]